MALVKPVVFQIAGYSNSGKTTVISKLIRKLAAEGWSAATIKHHGHGGEPDLPSDKDSERHLLAGARASLVEGGGKLIIRANGLNWSLEKKLEHMALFGTDLILIEGHKHEPFPKLLILRNEADFSLLDELVNIQVVFYWGQDIAPSCGKKFSVPVFEVHEEEGYDWLVDFLKKQRRSV